MTETRPRTLHYRKVEYFHTPSAGMTLESCLHAAMQRYRSRAERIVSAGNEILDALTMKHVANEGVYLHVVAYTRGDNANVVKHSGASGLEVVPPPPDADYLDGAVAALISGDHVFYCAEHIREGSLKRFIAHFIRKLSAAQNDEYMMASNFNMNRKGNEAKVRQIRQEGIQSIKLNAGLYEAEHQYVQRQRDGGQSVLTRVLGKTAKELRALYSEDDRLSTLHEHENLMLNVEIKFDRRRKGGDLGQVRAQKMAGDIIEGDEDGFVIETFNGQRITHEEIVLKKNVNLPILGKSFQHSDAWRDLKLFREDLVSADMIVR